MHYFQFCYNTMPILWRHNSNYIRHNPCIITPPPHTHTPLCTPLSLPPLSLLHVSKSKRCLKTFRCSESNSSEMRGLQHNNPTSLQIFENILLDANLVKPFKKQSFLRRDKPPWRCRDLFNTINRLLIDCWQRLIDYEYEPMGAAPTTSCIINAVECA